MISSLSRMQTGTQFFPNSSEINIAQDIQSLPSQSARAFNTIHCFSIQYILPHCNEGAIQDCEMSSATLVKFRDSVVISQKEFQFLKKLSL